MINGIGKSGPGRIDAQRPGLGQAGSAATAVAASTVGSAAGARGGGAIAELLADGPPVDGGKVAQIRAAIAEGRYSVDPDMIAERMIAADLPA